jgi:hypothetical protein
MTSRHPALQEGRIAIVTDVGRGMRWTLLVRETSAPRKRTAKPCGPDAPMLASSWRQCLRIALATVATKPGSPGRARNKPLKPLRRKRRNVWPTCGDLLACFLLLHARLRVRLAPGVSCALDFLGGGRAQLGRFSAASAPACVFFVIPGWCVSTRPGISGFRVRRFASPRNDEQAAV